MTKTKTTFLTLAGLLLGLALCGGLVVWQGLGADDVAALRRGFSSFWFLVVLALTAALMAAGERKWLLLSEAWGDAPARMGQTAFFRRHYLWQNWVGQFVPPFLAIVLGRGVAARKASGRARSGFSNGLFDQATDFLLLCAFLPAAALALFWGAGWVGFLCGAAVGLAATFLAAFAARNLLFPALRARWGAVLLLSFLRAVLTIARLLAGVYALGLALPLLPVAALTPVVSFVAFVPLTPGNLGLAEWGWTGGLVYAGQAARDAALYALGFRILVLVAQTFLLGLNEAYVRNKTAV